MTSTCSMYNTRICPNQKSYTHLLTCLDTQARPALLAGEQLQRQDFLHRLSSPDKPVKADDIARATTEAIPQLHGSFPFHSSMAHPHSTGLKLAAEWGSRKRGEGGLGTRVK